MRAVRWLEANTVKIADLRDVVLVRKALDLLATLTDGQAAAPTTIARKRAVFYGTSRYAVELGRLDSHPMDHVQWVAPKATDEVDRRTVVNPRQAGASRRRRGEGASVHGILWLHLLRRSSAGRGPAFEGRRL